MSKKNQAKKPVYANAKHEALAQLENSAHDVIPQATGLDVGTQNNKKLEPITLQTSQKKMYDELKTKSSKIRYLAAEGFKRGQIAVFLGIKYQHVRNVLITPLKTEAKGTKNIEE